MYLFLGSNMKLPVGPLRTAEELTPTVKPNKRTRRAKIQIEIRLVNTKSKIETQP
jgi:hypothetical protein